MGKYVKKRKKNNTSWRVVLLIVLLLLLIAAVFLVKHLSGSNIPEVMPEAIPGQETMAAEGQPSAQETQSPAGTDESPTAAPEAVNLLASEFQITRMDSFAGIYMEDGSDEIVSDVMMIILENTSDQDLQLARIDIQYSDFTAEFEVTNLPAGEKAVLLEKNRRSKPEEAYTSIASRDVVFFQEPMNLMEETFEITGGNGYLNVKNISSSATSGKIYVYYKHFSEGLLYGGITFRAAVDESLAPGETMRIVTGHYTAENSRILAVTCSE